MPSAYKDCQAWSINRRCKAAPKGLSKRVKVRFIITLCQLPRKSLFLISLCNLCVLCVSVVWFYQESINHGDTEDTEVAQRKTILLLKFSVHLPHTCLRTH
jgi:hypothetical protein